MYARLGAPPTLSDYHASSTDEVVIPMAAAGDWYILVYAFSVSDPGSYTLVAQTVPITLSSVTPDHHGNGADAVLSLSGAGFVEGTTVELVGGGVYPASSVSVDSFTRITATFASNTVPSGTYTIRATQPGGASATLPDAFTAVGGGSPRLRTDLIVPAVVGRQAAGTIYVEYANDGEVAMPAPLLVVRGSDNALMRLANNSDVYGAAWLYIKRPPSLGYKDTVQFLASGQTPGLLQPGEANRVEIQYIGLDQPWNTGKWDVQFNLGVLTADSTNIVDWSSIGDDMRPDTISADAWFPIWANFVAQAGTTSGGYVTMLDDNAGYLARNGRDLTTFRYIVDDVDSLLAFEFQQANGLCPVRTLAGATDGFVEAPGMPIVFERVYSEPISQRYALGSLGRGWSHNWEIAIEAGTNGDIIVIGKAGSRREFHEPLAWHAPYGEYLADAGDYGKLTSLGGGVFSLRETDGTLYMFRSDGKLDYVQDSNSNRITVAYTSGRLSALTHSSGRSLQIAYNGSGRISTITDSFSRQTTFTYDGSGEHLRSVREYDGRTTSYSYLSGQGAAKEHALSLITLPGGVQRHYEYDGQGRLAATYLAGGEQRMDFDYDSAGMTAVSDTLGHTNRYFFDDRGFLVKVENSLGHTMNMAFDSQYNLTRITDPAGRSRSFGWDARGNASTMTDPLGNSTYFGWSPLSRLTSMRDANGHLTRYASDTNGNLQTITYPDNTVESWGFGTGGNPVRWTNRRGNMIQYAYDADGRLTTKTYPDGVQAIYQYDARGNLTNAMDAVSTNRLSYDVNDQLVRIEYPGLKWLEFTYDAAGRRASSLDQLGHRLNYFYDSAGRLNSMSNETGSLVVRYSYDRTGRLAVKTLGNNIHTTYSYDPAGQLIGLTNYNVDGSVLSRFDYTYDSRGRRVSMDTLDGKWDYEYDDLGQLTHAVFASVNPAISNQDLTYIYDPVGNRLRTIENGVASEYTVNNMNQYTMVGDRTYVFDADGNMIEERSPADANTYAYNYENRLVGITTPSGTWQNVYDVFGERVVTVEEDV